MGYWSDTERFYNKRLLSEIVHIKKQTNGLNLQNDTVALNHAYIELLELSLGSLFI